MSQTEKLTLERNLPRARVALAWSGVILKDLPSREDQSNGEDGQRIVFSGRLNYQKNPQMFLRVAIRLLEKFPSLRIFMIGAGYHDSESDTLRDQLGSGFISRVSILDWLPPEENRGIMQSASAVGLRSRFESFGYVVAEAMAMEIPVVATRVDGLSDLVIHGETGFPVEVDDDDAMVDISPPFFKIRSYGYRSARRVANGLNPTLTLNLQ